MMHDGGGGGTERDNVTPCRCQESLGPRMGICELLPQTVGSCDGAYFGGTESLQYFAIKWCFKNSEKEIPSPAMNLANFLL